MNKDTRRTREHLSVSNSVGTPAVAATRELHSSERVVIAWGPWLVALLPLGIMLAAVRSGSHMQYRDYWYMFDRTFTGGGSIDLGALFTLHNEHPVALPQLLYWLNIHLAGGSNIALGVVVIALVAGQVALIAGFFTKGQRRTWGAAALVAASGFLLLSRHGVWNFMASMSGAAWMLANLLVVAAVHARWRGRLRWTIVFGIGASLSYGTGLIVWPVVILVGMVMERRWKPEWQLIVPATAVYGWYFLLAEKGITASSMPTVGISLDDLSGAGIFASTVVDPSNYSGRELGLVVLASGLGLSVLAYVRRRPGAPPWIGLYAYAVLALVMMSRGRYPGVTRGGVVLDVPSRYTSLSALLWISVLGLLLTNIRGRWSAAVSLLAVIVLVASFRVGGTAMEAAEDDVPLHDDWAVAYLLGLEGDVAYSLALLPPQPPVAARLERMGHYPFSGAFDADCGLLGESVEPPDAPRDQRPVDRVRRTTDGTGVRLVVALEGDARRSKCILVVDEDDEVVGVGTAGVGDGRNFNQRLDEGRAAALAPWGSSTYSVLIVTEDGRLRSPWGPVSADLLRNPGEVVEPDAAEAPG